jgi:hypothetical protein
MYQAYNVIAVVVEAPVTVTVRCKDCNTIFGRPRKMSLDAARRLKAQWDFHHMDGEYFMSIE